MSFLKKVCIITGGALGIDRCLTREFAANGGMTKLMIYNDDNGWTYSNNNY